MKLSPRDAAAFLQKPDPNAAGVLIYGPDTMRIAVKRQDLLAAMLGPGADEEMRLTRLPGADLRKDPALLQDGLKAQGFFPGARAVFVEEATDTIAPVLADALAAWQPGDAQIVVTAGQLTPRAKLRKLFEEHPTARALAIYSDPPGRAEIEAELGRAGLAVAGRDEMEALTHLGAELGPGDFRQVLEKLALFKFEDTSPVTLEDIDAVAPTSTEAGVDDIVSIVADGRADQIGPLMRRLKSQGVQAVTLLIFFTRHFRQLHAIASDPGGVDAGIGKLRPPVYGPRRDKMARQARGWGRFRLEQALGLLTDTDLELRSAGQTAPALALTERMMIRLAMMGRK